MVDVRRTQEDVGGAARRGRKCTSYIITKLKPEGC